MSRVLPLKWFWHLSCWWSCWWWPFLILSIKIIDHSSFCTSLLDQCCDVLGFVCICSVSSSSTLQIFWDASHLWWLLCPPICQLGHRASITPACPEQLQPHRGFRRWMSTIDTFQSGLPIPLFTFCSKLNKSARISEDEGTCSLSPPAAIQQRARVTASTLIVQLRQDEVEVRVHLTLSVLWCHFKKVVGFLQ